MDFMELLKPIIEGWMGQYGVLVQIVMIVGSLRLIMKPLVTLVQSVVAVTPSPKDDELLGKIMNSKVYSTIVFVLDYVASFKLPTIKK